MSMSDDFPAWTCPHCREANPAFGEVRCSHCGLHMISVQEQQWRQSVGKETVELLRKLVERPEKAGDILRETDIQPLLKNATLLEQLQPDWADWIRTARQQVVEWAAKASAFRRQWRSHLWILGLLILAPVLVLWLTKDLMLMGLMCLPVLGWAWIGLFAFRKARKP